MMPVLLHPGARSGAVSAVLVQGRSQNPVARLKAFEQLEEVLRDSIAVPDVLISLEKLVTLFQVHDCLSTVYLSTACLSTVYLLTVVGSIPVCHQPLNPCSIPYLLCVRRIDWST